MTKGLKIDFVNRRIEVTTDFYKKAQVFGTSEYEAFVKVFEAHPTFEVKKVKASKKKETYTEKKPQLKKFSYDKMEAYIRQKHPEDLEKFELEKKRVVFNTSTYHSVLVWFHNKYGEEDAFKTFAEMQEEAVENTTQFPSKEAAAAPEVEKIGA